MIAIVRLCQQVYQEVIYFTHDRFYLFLILKLSRLPVQNLTNFDFFLPQEIYAKKYRKQP